MKPFDLEKARAGHPVIQRSELPARIVDFHLKNKGHPLLVIINDCEGQEYPASYGLDGKYYNKSDTPDSRDLFMAPIKKEGWMNIYSRDDDFAMAMVDLFLPPKSGQMKILMIIALLVFALSGRNDREIRSHSG